MKISNMDIKRFPIHESLLKRYPHHDSQVAYARITFELQDVPIEVANAFRRVMIDELPGYCLGVDNPYNCITKHKDADNFMIDDFIAMNISMIPLRYHIPSKYKELRWSIKVENNTAMELPIYSRDLKLTKGSLDTILFDQNIMIGIIQPYRFVEVKDIFIKEGIGREHASFQNVNRCVCLPLDIEEYPREETHLPGGSQVDFSGYKVSTLEADPHHFKISGIVNATIETTNQEAQLISRNVCDNIINRITIIEDGIVTGANINVEFVTATSLETNECTLRLYDENQTISYLIQRYVAELYPLTEDTNVTITQVYIPHEFVVEIRVVSSTHTVKDVLINGLKEITRVFETLKKQTK